MNMILEERVEGVGPCVALEKQIMARTLCLEDFLKNIGIQRINLENIDTTVEGRHANTTEALSQKVKENTAKALLFEELSAQTDRTDQEQAINIDSITADQISCYMLGEEVDFPKIEEKVKARAILKSFFKDGEIGFDAANDPISQIALSESILASIEDLMHSKENFKAYGEAFAEILSEDKSILARDGELQVNMTQASIRSKLISEVFLSPEERKKIELEAEKMIKQSIPNQMQSIFLDPNEISSQLSFGIPGLALGAYTGQYGVDLGLATAFVLTSVILASIHPVTLMDKYKDVFSEKSLSFSASFSIFHLAGLAMAQLITHKAAQAGSASSFEATNLLVAGLVYAPLFAPLVSSAFGYLKTGLMSMFERHSEFINNHPFANNLGEMDIFFKNISRNHNIIDRLEQAIGEKDFIAAKRIMVEAETFIEKWSEVSQKTATQLSDLKNMCHRAVGALVDFENDPVSFAENSGNTLSRKRRRRRKGMNRG